MTNEIEIEKLARRLYLKAHPSRDMSDWEGSIVISWNRRQALIRMAAEALAYAEEREKELRAENAALVKALRELRQSNTDYFHKAFHPMHFDKPGTLQYFADNYANADNKARALVEAADSVDRHGSPT